MIDQHDIEQLSESEALTVFHKMRKHFDWAGTVFTHWDIESNVDEWLGDDYTLEQRERIVQSVKDGRIWNKWMIEALCLEGNEVLDDAIREAVDVENAR